MNLVFQILTASLLASGGLRNWPPASAPSTAVSAAMAGDFGPVAVRILSIVASGGGGPSTFDNEDNITISFSELCDCAGQKEVRFSYEPH